MTIIRATHSSQDWTLGITYGSCEEIHHLLIFDISIARQIKSNRRKRNSWLLSNHNIQSINSLKKVSSLLSKSFASLKAKAKIISLKSIKPSLSVSNAANAFLNIFGNQKVKSSDTIKCVNERTPKLSQSFHRFHPSFQSTHAWTVSCSLYLLEMNPWNPKGRLNRVDADDLNHS